MRNIKHEIQNQQHHLLNQAPAQGGFPEECKASSNSHFGV